MKQTKKSALSFLSFAKVQQTQQLPYLPLFAKPTITVKEATAIFEILFDFFIILIF
jgi:hypothetical protein